MRDVSGAKTTSGSRGRSTTRPLGRSPSFARRCVLSCRGHVARDRQLFFWRGSIRETRAPIGWARRSRRLNARFAGKRRSRGSPLIVAVILGAAVVVAAAVLLVWTFKPTEPKSAIVLDRAPSVVAPQPTGTVSGGVVRQIHRALHVLARNCPSGERPPRTDHPGRVGVAVDTILRFARNHPDARFAIDDENGTTLELLVVTREQLGSCAPSQVGRVARALPPPYRTAGSAAR